VRAAIAALALGGFALAIFVFIDRRTDSETLAEICARAASELSPSDEVDCFTAGYIRRSPSSTQTATSADERVHRGLRARLPLRAEDGDNVGSVVIRDASEEKVAHHTGLLGEPALAVEVRLDRPSDGWRADLRSGTCALPSVGRPEHTNSASPILWFTWDKLRNRQWAVDVYGADSDFVPVGCAEHRGRSQLSTGSRRLSSSRNPRREGSDVIVTLMAEGKVQGTARLTPDAGTTIVSIKHREISGDAGTLDPPAHIRPGTCEHLVAGRELLLDVLGDDDTDATWAYGTTTVPIPLPTLLARPHAIEIHDDFIGSGVYSCGDLAR
jgi:hypothetical protein